MKTQGPGDSRACVSHGPAPPHLPATFRRDERIQRCVLVVGRLHDEAVELVHRRAAADYTASGTEGHRWGGGIKTPLHQRQNFKGGRKLVFQAKEALQRWTVQRRWAGRAFLGNLNPRQAPHRR